MMAASTSLIPDDITLSSTQGADEVRLFPAGSLTVHTLYKAESFLHDAVEKAAGPMTVDLSRLSALDTSGALLLKLVAQRAREKNISCAIHTENETFQQLLHTVQPPPEEESAGRPSVFIRLLNALGFNVCSQGHLAVQLVGFLGWFLISLGRALAKTGRMRWTSLVFHMEQAGMKAVPIVFLLTFLIGTVVAYMGAEQLKQFGAQVFAVKLLEVTVLREMAVLITAIVVAGRSSSSFTAEIGAMVANEEVDAIRSMGLDPFTLLVLPRTLALLLTLPLLVFLANIAALSGGAVALSTTMDLSYSAFISELQMVAEEKNFWIGLVKTPFFALAIGLVGCFQGFRATGSAESVGLLTTVSVVQAIFLVILLDALFALFFTLIGV